MLWAQRFKSTLVEPRRITDVGDALGIVDAWLDTLFEGGRNGISVDLIREVEATLLR